MGNGTTKLARVLQEARIVCFRGFQGFRFLVNGDRTLGTCPSGAFKKDPRKQSDQIKHASEKMLCGVRGLASNRARFASARLPC